MIQVFIPFTTNLCRTQRDIINTPTSKNTSQLIGTVSLTIFFPTKGFYNPLRRLEFRAKVNPLNVASKPFFPFRWKSICRRFRLLLYFLIFFVYVTANWTATNTEKYLYKYLSERKILAGKLIWFIQHRSSLQTIKVLRVSQRGFPLQDFLFLDNKPMWKKTMEKSIKFFIAPALFGQN